MLGGALIGADKCDRLKVRLAAPVPVGSLRGSDAFLPGKKGGSPTKINFELQTFMTSVSIKLLCVPRRQKVEIKEDL